MQGYLAKPKPIRKVFVSGGDSKIIAQVVEYLRELNIKPILDNHNKTNNTADWRILADLYNQNMQALLKCDLCLALLDGSITDIADVCVEMGLAYAHGIPILGLCTSPEIRASAMIVGMCRGDDQLALDVEELRDLILEQIEITNAALQEDHQ